MSITTRMTQEEIFSEIRSVFSQVMNSEEDFPFTLLQSTGRGCKSLSVPSLSSSFRWDAKQINGLGDKCVYVIAEKELHLQEVGMFILVCFTMLFRLSCLYITFLFLLLQTREECIKIETDSSSCEEEEERPVHKKTCTSSERSRAVQPAQPHSSNQSSHEYWYVHLSKLAYWVIILPCYKYMSLFLICYILYNRDYCSLTLDEDTIYLSEDESGHVDDSTDQANMWVPILTRS